MHRMPGKKSVALMDAQLQPLDSLCSVLLGKRYLVFCTAVSCLKLQKMKCSNQRILREAVGYFNFWRDPVFLSQNQCFNAIIFTLHYRNHLLVTMSKHENSFKICREVDRLETVFQDGWCISQRKVICVLSKMCESVWFNCSFWHYK